MADLITRSDDGRLAQIEERDAEWETVNEGFPPADCRLLLHSLRAALAERDAALSRAEAAERELADEKKKVANLEEYMLKGVAFRDELQAAKDVAYRERNQLVLFLTRCFPSHRCKHPETDAAWERDWMNIICVHGPQGQMAWHIHDSGLPAFEHLLLEESHWDGHTTEEKYVRLYRCDMNSPEIASLRREVDRHEEEAKRLREVIYWAHELAEKRLQGTLDRWDETLRGVQDERDRLRRGLESAQMEVRGANYLIASLERLFPNWKSYRDLDDCIRCELAELRRRAGKEEG